MSLWRSWVRTFNKSLAADGAIACSQVTSFLQLEWCPRAAVEGHRLASGVSDDCI
jgi:hypothetical protein